MDILHHFVLPLELGIVVGALLGANAAQADGATQTRIAWEQSAKAAPGFATKQQRAVPQIDDANTFFRQLKPLKGTRLENILLLCDVVIDNPKRWDSFAAPDLLITAKLGKRRGAKATVFGGQDRGAVVFSLPQVTLYVGDKLTLDVSDRDVFQNEHIGDDINVFTGELPMTFDGETFTGECRGASADEVKRRIEPRLEAADRALTRFEKASVRANKRKHFANQAAQEAKEALVQVAALAGWDAPRLQKRVQRMGRLSQESVARLVATAKGPGSSKRIEGAGATLTYQGLVCGGDALSHLEKTGQSMHRSKIQQADCAVVVDVKRTLGERFQLSTFPASLGTLGNVALLTATGQAVPLVPVLFERDGQPLQKIQLKRGQHAKVWLVPSTKLTLQKPDPAGLLWVQASGGEAFFKLR